jgi:hypothetical protein
VREQLGFTIRDVEAASVRIAEQHHSDDFAIPLSRLSDIETKGVTPSIYRLYTLSVVYRRDLREILTWYWNSTSTRRLPTFTCRSHHTRTRRLRLKAQACSRFHLRSILDSTRAGR